MSIAKLTTPYTNPYVVSLDDVDLIKIRSLEASPLTHEDLDDNFANLAYKVNELVDIIGGSSSVITADANGKVGIGTATPELAFHVKSSSTDGTAIFENDDEGTNAAPDLILRRSSASPADEDYLGHLRWQGRKIGQDGIHSTVDYADIYGRIAVAGEAGSNGGAGKLVFRTRQDTGSHNFMVFDEVGNLGIGTRTPVKPLEIQFTDNTAYAGSGTGNALRVRNISEAADTFSSLEMFAGQTSEGNANIARIFAVKESTTSTATSLAFTTRGSSVISEKMRIDSDGNVGIGTTDPSDELTISATSPAIRLVDESDSSHGTVGYNASFLSLNADGGQDAINSGIQFNVDSSEKMRIDSAGNVGIGTTSPNADLEIFSAVKPIIRLTGTGNNALNTNFGEIQFYNRDGSGDGPNVAASIHAQSHSSTGSGGSLVFSTEAAEAGTEGQSAEPRMTILSNGNVGISTTNPQEALHIKGDHKRMFIESDDYNLFSLGRRSVTEEDTAYLQMNDEGTKKIILDTSGNSYFLGGNLGVGIDNPPAVFTVNGEGSDNVLAGDLLGVISNVNGKLVDIRLEGKAQTTGATMAGSVGFDPNNNCVYLANDNDQTLNVTSGNVGIGTTNPSAKLHIENTTGSSLILQSVGSYASGHQPAIVLAGKNPSEVNKNLARIRAASEGTELGALAFDVRMGAGSPHEEAMRIDSDGNVGIGTDSPSSKLTIGFDDNGTDGISFRSSSNANLAKILASNETSSQNGNLQFHTRLLGTAVERMRIDSDGNVGIGTTDPSAKLDVNGLGRFSVPNGGQSLLSWSVGDSTGENQPVFALVTNETNNQDRVTLNSDGDSYFNGGNVGIGTTTPASHLHVVGQGYFNRSHSTSAPLYAKQDGAGPSAYFMGGNVGIGTTNPATKITVLETVDSTFGNITPSASDSVIMIANSPTNEAANNHSSLQFNLNAGTHNHIASISLVSESATLRRGALAFCTDNGTTRPEAMRIDSDGNVGIGTTNPNAKLSIQGVDATHYQTHIAFKNTSGSKEYAIGAGIHGVTNTGFGILDRNTNDPLLYIKHTGEVGIGTETPSAKLTVNGSLSKSSGSFRIDHPIKPETHDLVHSFVEAPQADNIYRGKVDLVAGKAEVNIDSVAGMTEGTFVLLNREIQVFTSNESDWDAVRGRVEGNKVIIECQNTESTATISWLVIGERQDKHMYDTEWTDENGKVIVEPLKPEPAPEPKVETESEEVITEEPVAEEAPVEETQVDESQPEEVAQVSLGQVSLGQVSLGQVSLGQVSLGQVSLGQVSLSESPLDEIKEIRAEDGKEYVRIGDKEYEVLGKNEDGSLVLDDDVTNNG